MPMSTSHRVLVRLTFDRPCSRTEAIELARGTLKGEEYALELFSQLWRDKAPETFRIRSVAPVPKNRR